MSPPREPKRSGQARRAVDPDQGTTRVYSSEERAAEAAWVVDLLSSGMTAEAALEAWLAAGKSRFFATYVFEDALGISHLDAKRLVLADGALTDTQIDSLLAEFERND